MPGVVEVLDARFADHQYPMHTHDAWALLVVESGAIRYDLERHEHGVHRPQVTVLPPYVAHDGRTCTPGGFHKRVLYLEPDLIDTTLLGRAVDRPGWADPELRREIDRLHRAVSRPGDELEGESRLALITDRLTRHLRADPAPRAAGEPVLVRNLRDLLDGHLIEGVTLDEASRVLGAPPPRLVRAFRRETGIAPHQYVVGRRLDLARRLLLDGGRPAEVAVATGFYDQAHLTRHFRRLLGVPPGRYVASAAGPQRAERPQRPIEQQSP